MQTTLWQKIQAFDFDQPLSEYGFSVRLAAENNWTKQFTEAAILEYKKFMFLAASSNFMVAPSAIVDIVWHQHLIFTQSYQQFCELLGKTIQHIPSTHNRNEVAKFKAAKERTTQLYQQQFGEQPANIWEKNDMYDGLNLPKAKYKFLVLLVFAALALVLLAWPFRQLIKPILVQIDNPYFLFGYLLLGWVTFTALHFYNKSKLRAMLNGFDNDAFVYQLEPVELAYLQTKRPKGIVNVAIDPLVKDNIISVFPDYSMKMDPEFQPTTVAQHQVKDVFDQHGGSFYPPVLKALLKKPIFANTVKVMDQFKKYVLHSQKFVRLFFSNFALLGVLLLIGYARLHTGIEREKPVILLTLTMLVVAIGSVVFLYRLTQQLFNQLIPELYKSQLITSTKMETNWEWNFFLQGSLAFSAAFLPFADYVDRNTHHPSPIHRQRQLMRHILRRFLRQ
jgi:uncharacterized protein (TIGR04222 family)